MLISFTLKDPELSRLNVMVAGQHVQESPLPLVPFKERYAKMCSDLTDRHEKGVSSIVNIDLSAR